VPPHACIIFNLGVGLHEDAVIPGIVFAVVITRFVVGPKITDDPRAGWIGSADRRPAAEKPIRLIEIRSLGHIRRITRSL